MIRYPRALTLVAPKAPILVLVLLLALTVSPTPAGAQLGRLRNMAAGVEKGKVYGIDVTEAGSSIVFVMDLTPVVELPPGAADNLKQMVAQQGEAYVRRKLAEEGSDWALRAAGPAGLVVKEVMVRRRDRAERARNHVRAAIEGLGEDQRFGIVSFEAGPRSWRSPAATASAANREAARDFVGGVQKVEGDGFLRSALLVAAGLTVDEPAMAYPAAPMAGGDPATMQAAMAAVANDPQAQAAMIAAMGTDDPQAQAAMLSAGPSASPTGAGAGALPGVPAAPAGSTVSAESLLRGIELALELDPETIVIVVAAAPAEEPVGFVARVAELVGERDVTIHAAVFGEKQSGGVLGVLAEAHGGKLLTGNEGEE